MVAWRIFCALAAICGLAPSTSKAADCAPGVLGTSRVMAIEAKTTPRVGKPFASPLPLDSHEVILTFDDGPRSTTTAQVLDALAQQCVRAIFFVIGENAVERVLYHGDAHAPLTRFFRFPGLATSPTLLDRLAGRGIVTFGADLWASDWRLMTPDAELKLAMQRLNTVGRGIVLLHDTKVHAAAMLPAFLEALREQNYRAVAVVPAP